jgi:hypothetical protein
MIKEVSNTKFSSGVLWKSSHGDLTSGPIRTYRWKSSIQQPNNSTETFWVLKSNVRISKFLECKKLEHFLQGIPIKEMQALFDAPGVISDNLFLDLLRSKNSLLSLNDQLQILSRNKLLLQRLQGLQSMLGITCWTVNLLYTYLGDLKYELVLLRVPIRKVKKFSGWVRNSSAVGTKRSRGKSLDTEIFESSLIEEFDYYHFLISEELDFSLLGFRPGDLLYTFLETHFRGKRELPIHFKHLLKYRNV